MEPRDISDALGASTIVDLHGEPAGPGDALALMRLLHEQLQPRTSSRRGRPTNPDWAARRLIPFSERSWSHLQSLAQAMSTRERRISPAQLAAAIIEAALPRLVADDRIAADANGFSVGAEADAGDESRPEPAAKTY